MLQISISQALLPTCLFGAPLDKLLKILHCGYTQHKSSVGVSDNSKLLRPVAVRGRLLFAASTKEDLEFLERRLHGDDLVCAALALESRHCGRQGIRRLDLAGIQLLLQERNGQVAQKRPCIAVDDRQVCVIALKGGEEGDGDGVGRVNREGGWRVDIFNSSLGEAVS